MFFSYEDIANDKLVALLRLRLTNSWFIPELEGAALIREVHVYGRQTPVGGKNKGNKQHLGLGGKLMTEAENFAKSFGYRKMAVISGIGTREYYKKKGYEFEGTYMIKGL